jgi:hypothetical protein
LGSWRFCLGELGQAAGLDPVVAVEGVLLLRAEVLDDGIDVGGTYLKGDRMGRDLAITAYLQSQRVDGVPLYVFYPADGASPVWLGQILTPESVLAAIC